MTVVVIITIIIIITPRSRNCVEKLTVAQAVNPSTAMQMRTALFRVVTRGVAVISYRRFGTT